ncbi:MAG: plastocyanin/azurin family copper-binding protein [Kofleriaceae bacterium]
MRTNTTWIPLALFVTGLVTVLSPDVHADKKKSAATKADVERLESKIEEQQKQIDKLVKAQQKHFEALKAAFESPVSSNDTKPDTKTDAKTDVKADEAKPEPKVVAPAPKAPDKGTVGFTDARPKQLERPKKPEGTGTIVGKVTGAGGAIVYVDTITESTRGTAAMKQEGKAFLPNVLVVQKGTTVAFPNMDAFFHNVFSVTPDHSFDLGSYRQGESRSVTMTKTGVLSVYCNMHPQMVGHILVTPSSVYARAGKDGFFRLTNIPAGKHRVVAWAPNAKPVTAEAEVSDAGVVTLELELKKGRAAPHTKKDGLPYGSYGE